MSIVADTTRSVIGYTGGLTDPQEVRQLRESSMDYHRTIGQLVIHKHRWNERDVREGLAQICPFHDPVYDQDAYDDICFGTGYVGGFDNGTLVPVTIGDTQEDVFRPNPQGILIHERHPGLAAPWIPEMGDDDLIIIVEVDPATRNISEMGDRYLLRQVQPVTMRGPHFTATFHMKPYRVSQESMIDLLPYAHPFYNVPINFDYSRVPVPVPPDYPPLPAGWKYSEAAYNVRVIGHELGMMASYDQDVRVAVAGQKAEAAYGVRVVGEPSGTHVHWT